MRALPLFLLLLSASQSIAAAAPPSGESSGGNPAEEMLRMRDPFKRPDVEIGKVVPKTELESYTVDSFKMVAVLTGPNKIRAMLLAPDGKNYLVHAGMKIGTRNGVIQKITEEAIQVRERIVNVLGQEENVDSEILLSSEQKPETAKKSTR